MAKENLYGKIVDSEQITEQDRTILKNIFEPEPDEPFGGTKKTAKWSVAQKAVAILQQMADLKYVCHCGYNNIDDGTKPYFNGIIQFKGIADLKGTGAHKYLNELCELCDTATVVPFDQCITEFSFIIEDIWEK